MTKQLINPADLPAPRGFNHGILCARGRILFLAGQDASDAAGAIVAHGDLAAQYEQVLRNLRAVVTAAGGRMTDIVKLNVFVRDRADYVSKRRELGHIHRAYFGDYYPAMALFEVTGFFQTDNLIEMEGFAFIDDDGAAT